YTISSLLGDLYSEIRTSYHLRLEELILDVDPLLPSQLNGDVRKIKKIMRHLISNSLKFTEQGCVLVRLRGIEKPYGLNLFLEVIDTGIGIEDGEIDRLTEQFYQAMGGKSKSVGGLGLGLPIVHGLVTEMNGFFQISSARGRGTRAQISIPQTIIDKAPCMRLEHPERLAAIFYDRPDSYADGRVRDYYNETVIRLARGLGVPLHFATTLGSLEERVAHGGITHVFTGWSEYHNDMDFFDALSEQLKVVVAVDDPHERFVGTGIRTINLPFNGFSVTRELANATAIDHNTETFLNRQMICPYIRALVVDDEPMNLVVAKGIFRDYRLIVETATSGKEAIEKCQSSTYDLIFLDHMMPQMDGVETMHRLRKAHPERTLRIIALTANAVSGAKDMFFNEGFDEFLAKPLEYPELERVLRRLLPESSITYISARH
ncbi:MAG: response regulator, partial [Lachnospiraceae bacterium]|nr:response regulator [Lachnospiraceae bacterium]